MINVSLSLPKCHTMKMYVLCLIEYHAMKIHGGLEVQLHAHLNLAVDGGEWSVSCPSYFTTGGKTPGTH